MKNLVIDCFSDDSIFQLCDMFVLQLSSFLSLWKILIQTI